MRLLPAIFSLNRRRMFSHFRMPRGGVRRPVAEKWRHRLVSWAIGTREISGAATDGRRRLGSRFSLLGGARGRGLQSIVWGGSHLGICPKTALRRRGLPQTPEQTHPTRAYYCSYVLRFSTLERDEGGPSLFLKIVFDKGGAAAY